MDPIISLVIHVLELIKKLLSFIKTIWNWNFSRQVKLIENNLKFRERVELPLQQYIIENYKNGIKDIGIRFVYWKNYLNHIDVEDDGFKHFLRVEYNDGVLIDSSWLDNKGIFFQEHLWFYSRSVYEGKRGIFFFAPSGQNYYGFTEHRNCILIRHLPFANIINFDFKEVIEYEPVFYIKYKYTNYKKLYSSSYTIREKHGAPYFQLELDSKNYRNYNVLLRLRISISKYFGSKES